MSDTIQLSRRGFIKGLVAATALATTAASLGVNLSRTPVLYGDGVTDDTEALQALCDGRGIIRNNMLYVRAADRLEIVGGNYRTTRAVIVGNNSDMFVSIRRNWFSHDEPAAIKLGKARYVELRENSFMRMKPYPSREMMGPVAGALDYRTMNYSPVGQGYGFVG